MYECPGCRKKILAKELLVVKSEYKPRWYEIFYDSSVNYFCPNCKVQLELKGKLRLFSAIIFLVALLGLVDCAFNPPRLLLAIIVVAVCVPILLFIQSKHYVVVKMDQ